MWWSIEPADDGYFRIRNQWDGQDGYLGRNGLWNGFEWEPQPSIYLGALDPDGWHQQWSLQPAGNGRVALVNRWDPATGVLTRDGTPIGGGAYGPTPTVSLHRAADWSSQHWELADN